MNCSKQLKMREIFLPNFINITLISILHKTNIKIGTNCKLILLMNMYANISLIFFISYMVYIHHYFILVSGVQRSD